MRGCVPRFPPGDPDAQNPDRLCPHPGARRLRQGQCPGGRRCRHRGPGGVRRRHRRREQAAERVVRQEIRGTVEVQPDPADLPGPQGPVRPGRRHVRTGPARPGRLAEGQRRRDGEDLRLRQARRRGQAVLRPVEAAVRECARRPAVHGGRLRLRPDERRAGLLAHVPDQLPQGGGGSRLHRLHRTPERHQSRVRPVAGTCARLGRAGDPAAQVRLRGRHRSGEEGHHRRPLLCGQGRGDLGRRPGQGRCAGEGGQDRRRPRHRAEG